LVSLDKTVPVALLRFDKRHLSKIWQIGFSKETPEWSKWNAPYFNEYRPFEDFEQFESSEISEFLMSEGCRCIVVGGQPIGMVSKSWINEATRWLEIGIVIYDEQWWNQGIATKALKMWITAIFDEIDVLEHVGMTTWSGNQAMMVVAEKIGFLKEGQIRKVRYYQGHYYDSLKYGVLREEWNAKSESFYKN
jgi:acetyltransferase, GNAT family